jgi:hypothetical protein
MGTEVDSYVSDVFFAILHISLHDIHFLVIWTDQIADITLHGQKLF